MSHFLFAWEFGSGLGHLSSLAQLATELEARGHRVSFVLRDLSRAHAVLGVDATILQAPVWQAPPPMRRPATEYADLLARLGYLDSNAVSGFVRGWRQLFSLLAPDVLLCEYAPTALLAAHGSGLPRAMLGTGFTCPPARARLRFDDAPPAPGGEDMAARVLDAMNRTLDAVAAPRFADLGELHAVERQFVCTWRELDPFARSRRDARYLGPRGSRAQGGPAAWPPGAGPRVFAYLKPGVPGTDVLLEAIAAAGVCALAFVPGAPEGWRRRFERAGTRLVTAPVTVSDALAGCDLVVGHGGHGMTCAALLAGVPVLLVPAQSEQGLTAQRLQQQGLARTWRPGGAQPATAALGAALGDAALRDAARAFAREHESFDEAAVTVRIADEIEALAG